MKKERKTTEVDKFLQKQCNRVWAFFKKIPKTWYDEDERLHLLEISEGPFGYDDVPCKRIVTINLRRAGADNDVLEYFQHPADDTCSVCVKEFYDKIHKYTPFPPTAKFYEVWEEVNKIFDAYYESGID